MRAWYQNETNAVQKKKVHINIFHEIKRKSLHQNISKLNQSMYKKNYALWQSGIYSRCLRLVQHSKTNQRYEFTISYDDIKQFDKIQHPFIVKNSKPVRNRGELPQLDKKASTKTLQKHTWRWKTEFFPSKFRNKTRMFVLTTLIQHSTGSSRHWNKARKERYTDWKERKKTGPPHR